ncbi:MAG: response regulator [bacterium]|nr:response regulator [Gammaproteobacteria bacterium]HIL84942.1 response regulator [Pseudomonadales bacterium]
MSKEIILVVDDDERICRLLERYLSKQGFEVKSSYSGEGLEKIIADLQPSLLLLDLSLPGEHGFDIAKRVRALDKKIGIIILTGSGDSIDQVVGLEIGADDFVAKPFDERQLLARIRSVLRRVEASTIETEDDRDTIEIGDITLNLESYEATNKEGSIGLTTHEFQLVAILAKSQGRVLNRDQILDQLSGRDWAPYDRSIDVLVGKIRNKVKAAGEPNLIITVRNAGYKIAASGKVAS